MRKYLVGMVFGLILELSVAAYGFGGEMMGKVIDAEYPLWLHGNKLEKDVVVIEGVSYAPVRMIGESLGLDVEFKDQQVFLNRKEKKVLPNYKVKSDVIKVDQPGVYFIKDGEWYYPIAVFGGSCFTNWDDSKKEATFNMPWGETIIYREEYYSPGVSCYLESGRTFVSLTALGLKPVVGGDTVTLVRD